MNSEQQSTMSGTTQKCIHQREKPARTLICVNDKNGFIQRKNLNEEYGEKKYMEQTIVSGEFEKRKVIHCL